MAFFSGWSLSEVEKLNGQQLLYWVAQANRIAERRRKDAKNVRSS